MVKGLEDKGCKEWLSSLDWFSPELRRPRGGTELCSLMAVTRPEGMAWACIREGSGRVLRKGTSSKGGQALEQAPQDSGHTPKLLVFKEHSDNVLRHRI